MPLDDATTTFLTAMAALGARPMVELTPDEARRAGAELVALWGEGPEMERVYDQDLVSADRTSFRVRVMIPRGRPDALVVYLHGGGWVVGSIEGFDTFGRMLAQAANAAVLLVDYRLSPEHRYPAAVEDTWAALLWADAHVADLLGSRVPIVVAGDSAGGNLAAVTAVRARDAGAPALALQVLVYPVTNADFATTSYLEPENQLILSSELMQWFWDHYVPDTAARNDPGAAPLLTEDLAGVAPAVVATAEYDVLRDEGEAFADRLVAAGVPVVRRRFEGQTHGFFTMVNVLPGSARCLEFVGREVRSAVAAKGR